MNATYQEEHARSLCAFLDTVIKPQLDQVIATLIVEPSAVLAKRGQSFNIGPVVFYFMYDVEDFDYQASLVRQGDPDKERMDVSVSFLKSLGVL